MQVVAGARVGNGVGIGVGVFVGPCVGASVGMFVGLCVGVGVGSSSCEEQISVINVKFVRRVVHMHVAHVQNCITGDITHVNPHITPLKRHVVLLISHTASLA